MRPRERSGLLLLALLALIVAAGLFFTMRSTKHATRMPHSTPAASPPATMLNGRQ